MTNAEPASTRSASESDKKADCQPSLVAVSEENLAALLRTIASSADPKEEHLREHAETAPVPDPLDKSVSAPVEIAASHAVPDMTPTVKEHRSAIVKSGMTPAAPPGKVSLAATVNINPISAIEQDQSLPATRLPKVTLPKTNPLIPTQAKSASTKWMAISQDQSYGTSRNRLVLGLIIGAVIVVVSISVFLTRAPSSKTTPVVASALKDKLLLQVQPAPSPGPGTEGPPQILYEQSVAVKELVAPSGPISKRSAVALGSVSPDPGTETSTRSPSSGEGASAVPQSSQLEVRAFAPPAVYRTTQQSPILDAPPALPIGPVTLPVANLPTSLTPTAPPPPANAARQQRVQVESNVQEANLIKKVTPLYPPFAKSAGIQGIVRFTALIGKDGRIQNLKLISGPTPLVTSASAALKEWIYRPTLLNGEPVEVVTQINVNFDLKRD